LNPEDTHDPRTGEHSDDLFDDAFLEEVLADDRAHRVPAGAGFLGASELSAEQTIYRRESGRPPSLPIVLISAACGITGGIIGLYISYSLLGWGAPLSAGSATLGLLLGLGVSGAALSAATGERGAVINMAFSCTLIVLVVLFMALCAIAGATVATLLVRA
jgi:hypothetical protein